MAPMTNCRILSPLRSHYSLFVPSYLTHYHARYDMCCCRGTRGGEMLELHLSRKHLVAVAAHSSGHPQHGRARQILPVISAEEERWWCAGSQFPILGQYCCAVEFITAIDSGSERRFGGCCTAPQRVWYPPSPTPGTWPWAPSWSRCWALLAQSRTLPANRRQSQATTQAATSAESRQRG